MAEMEVEERVRDAGAQLTTAERRVAQVVLERPQLVGFGTVADLAEAAGAGAATVVRLAAKLGFDGFSALQTSIQRDLSRQLRPAAERIRELGGDLPLTRHRSAVLSNVQATLDAVDQNTLDAVIARCSPISNATSSCSPATPSAAWHRSSPTSSERSVPASS